MVYVKQNGLITKILSFLRVAYVKLYFGKLLEYSKNFQISCSCKIIIQGKNCAMKIGNKVSLADHVHLQVNENSLLKIGDNCQINSYSRIIALNKIEIGNNVAIAQFVSILDHNHAYNFQDNKMRLDGYDTAPLKIGNNVWIADKCTILKGANIGDNVIIAANTLVNKTVPPNCIIAGIPFKIIKQL